VPLFETPSRARSLGKYSMTATLDAVTHTNGQFEEGEVEPLDSNLPLDQDEDQTVRPNGFHLERLVPARTSPDELPALHVSPPASPSAAFDYEHRPSSRHSSITHTEVTGGITDRSSRRRSIMDVRLFLLVPRALINLHPAQ
jgi:hypothetical protein